METDLIDWLGIYRARTIPKPYHFTPSTKAREELHRWPREWPHPPRGNLGLPAPPRPERQSEPYFPDSKISV
jgi:hypothetical protein